MKVTKAPKVPAKMYSEVMQPLNNIDLLEFLSICFFRDV